jgi:hypothetical protein
MQAHKTSEVLKGFVVTCSTAASAYGEEECAKAVIFPHAVYLSTRRLCVASAVAFFGGMPQLHWLIPKSITFHCARNECSGSEIRCQQFAMLHCFPKLFKLYLIYATATAALKCN